VTVYDWHGSGAYRHRLADDQHPRFSNRRSASGRSDPIYTHSFAFDYKAREAAEDFLLARYRLYTTVYLHKTTRGCRADANIRLLAVAQAAENRNCRNADYRMTIR
jgi:HD superfamily phosphohydrolase